MKICSNKFTITNELRKKIKILLVQMRIIVCAKIIDIILLLQ